MPDEDSLSTKARRTPWNNGKLIYRRTGNLRAVQLLLGHTKIESTVRYLGIFSRQAPRKPSPFIEEEAIVVAIRLACRRCSPNGVTRSPERRTEGR